LIAAWLFLSSAPPTVLGAAAIGFWWLFGVTLQIGAGVLRAFARSNQGSDRFVDGAAGK
jgi:hypothetical protein